MSDRDPAFNPTGQRFVDKVCIVTGAASGIGAATARRLAAEGATTICVDLDGAGAEATAAGCVADGHTAHGYALDVSSADQISALIERIAAEFGRIDVVCNVAGILRFASLEETTLEQWQQIMDVNLTGTFLMCQKAMEHLGDFCDVCLSKTVRFFAKRNVPIAFIVESHHAAGHDALTGTRGRHDRFRGIGGGIALQRVGSADRFGDAELARSSRAPLDWCIRFTIRSLWPTIEP